MTALSVNVNKIALLRNSRGSDYPSVTGHALTCIEAGADGITVHPRPDCRHICPHDVSDLAALLADHPQLEFNIEGNPLAGPNAEYPGFMSLVEQAKPHQVTLVPDSEQQLTSDHGFDLHQSGDQIEPIIAQLKNWGCRVSLFMDADREQIALAKEIGADRIELYTGPFAEAYSVEPRRHAKILFERYCDAAHTAYQLGLGVNAGHDLNLDNLQMFAALPHLDEVSIGHALVVDGLAMGLATAVQRYKTALVV